MNVFLADAHVTVWRAGTRELCEAAETLLSRHFQERLHVVEFAREPSASRSSFPVEELWVTLADGRRLPMMLKGVSREELSSEAARAKPPFVYDPVREEAAYLTLLAEEHMGTPACYGAISEARSGWRWLLLERVPGVELSQVGKFEAWEEAARWLARLHGRFAGDHGLEGKAGRAHLLRYDREFFETWPRRALAFFTAARRRTAGELAGLLRLASGYAEIIEGLLDLPVTLIHGEFYCSNILVEKDVSGWQVRPVDWEMAAVAPGLMDLAALSSGKWSGSDRIALAMAYYQELCQAQSGFPYGSLDELLLALDYCRLHVAMQWVGWSSNWDPPPEHHHDWLNEALHIAGRLGL